MVGMTRSFRAEQHGHAGEHRPRPVPPKPAGPWPPPWADLPTLKELERMEADPTMKHYVAARGIVARAVDALPQPAAFAGNGKGKPAP